MTEPNLKLPRGADELLLDFPIDEPDFDAMALAIEARLLGARDGTRLDQLVRAPNLAPEAGEPTPRPPAAKGGLAELARKSVQKKADDESAALAKELMAATSHARRPDPEMVARVRAAGKLSATSTPLPEERTSGVVPRAPAAAAPAPAKPDRARRGLVIGVLGGALAVAAAVALLINARGPQRSLADAPLAAAEVNQPVDPGAKAPAPREPAAHEPPPHEGVLTPDRLPQAPAAKTSEAKAAAAQAPAAEPLAAASRPASAKAQAKREDVVLDDEIRRAQAAAELKPEPPAEPPMKPAEGNTDSIPLSPSGGAVSTALGAVRSGAQACLAGQNDAVVAVVTFASDGHVASVSAGGPSGGCIQAALSKAHVAPFAKERFSATTTIRPP